MARSKISVVFLWPSGLFPLYGLKSLFCMVRVPLEPFFFLNFHAFHLLFFLYSSLFFTAHISELLSLYFLHLFSHSFLLTVQPLLLHVRKIHSFFFVSSCFLILRCKSPLISSSIILFSSPSLLCSDPPQLLFSKKLAILRK